MKIAERISGIKSVRWTTFVSLLSVMVQRSADALKAEWNGTATGTSYLQVNSGPFMCRVLAGAEASRRQEGFGLTGGKMRRC